MKKLKSENMVLGVIDRGDKQGGHIPVRDVILQEVEGGAHSLVMFATGVPSSSADQIAEWFAGHGVEVRRIDKVQAADTVPAVPVGQPQDAAKGVEDDAG